MQEATNGHALSVSAFYFFSRTGLIKHFHLDAVVLAR
jgi:hypothetical protein